MKRVAFWIVMITFTSIVMTSAPGYSAAKWDRSNPVGAADYGTTVSNGTSEPVEAGGGDDGDADGVAGLKDPSRGISAVPQIERIILRLRSWWMLFLSR